MGFGGANEPDREPRGRGDRRHRAERRTPEAEQCRPEHPADEQRAPCHPHRLEAASLLLVEHQLAGEALAHEHEGGQAHECAEGVERVDLRRHRPADRVVVHGLAPILDVLVRDHRIDRVPEGGDAGGGGVNQAEVEAPVADGAPVRLEVGRGQEDLVRVEGLVREDLARGEPDARHGELGGDEVGKFAVDRRAREVGDQQLGRVAGRDPQPFGQRRVDDDLVGRVGIREMAFGEQWSIEAVAEVAIARGEAQDGRREVGVAVGVGRDHEHAGSHAHGLDPWQRLDRVEVERGLGAEVWVGQDVAGIDCLDHPGVGGLGASSAGDRSQHDADREREQQRRRESAPAPAAPLAPAPHPPHDAHGLIPP